MKTTFAVLAMIFLATAVSAASLEDLAMEGYAVAVKTQVQGEYTGCEYGKQIGLMNGLVFVCNSYLYRYAYMPRVLILQQLQTGNLKVMIDGQEMIGTLYKR